MSTSQVEETLKRIQSKDGVVGVLIVNNAGIPIKSTMNNKLSVQYSGLVQQLVETSNSVLKTKSTSDELITMRLRTKKNEIIIIPKNQYIMIIVQIPTGTGLPI